MKRSIVMLFVVFVFCLLFAGSVASQTAVPPTLKQIVAGTTLVADLNGRYLSPNDDEWKTEEKYFLRVEKVVFTLPPLGVRPGATISGTAYDRRKNMVGLFKSTISILSFQFFQFSVALSKADGISTVYEGDLFLEGTEFRGIFLSETTEHPGSLPSEIGSGDVKLALEK